MEDEKLLSFKEFMGKEKDTGVDKSPAYFEITGYWDHGISGNSWRKAPHYIKFKKQAPELNNELSEEIKNLPQKKREKLNEKKLYKAYKIMFAHTPSNKLVIG